mmetsp:Transcript_45409/g.119254  ORF Transcript_45409/g.119254 Transcript_45409/m.119254 type:complete len:232 (-) Transcript_45409:2082-2777(-)
MRRRGRLWRAARGRVAGAHAGQGLGPRRRRPQPLQPPRPLQGRLAQGFRPDSDLLALDRAAGVRGPVRVGAKLLSGDGRGAERLSVGLQRPLGRPQLRLVAPRRRHHRRPQLPAGRCVRHAQHPGQDGARPERRGADARERARPGRGLVERRGDPRRGLLHQPGHAATHRGRLRWHRLRRRGHRGHRVRVGDARRLRGGDHRGRRQAEGALRAALGRARGRHLHRRGRRRG